MIRVKFMFREFVYFSPLPLVKQMTKELHTLQIWGENKGGLEVVIRQSMQKSLFVENCAL